MLLKSQVSKWRVCLPSRYYGCANRNNYWEFSLRDSERSLIAYHPFDGELLWGATARMTVSFLNTLDILKVIILHRVSPERNEGFNGKP